MNLWFDVKYASRLMINSWGYSLMCVAVVALSVGLAVWSCALAYSQSWRPLPYPDGDWWYSLQIATDKGGRVRPVVDAYTWQQLAERNASADHLGAFASRAMVLSEGEATTTLRGALISPTLFAATSHAPLLGRAFVGSDADRDGAAVAIISYTTWQTYFAGDRNIIGRTARIDATPVRIVGVMPEDFFTFLDFEIWMPLRLPKLARPEESTLTLTPFVRVRPPGDPARIELELQRIVDDVSRGYPRLFNAARRVALIPAARTYSHGNKPIVMMISLVALGVMLIGCVNISMVFLARLLERSRELALRTALGASRGRLLRQSLLETALIVAVGLLAGFFLAFLGIEWTHGIDAFGSRILADGRSADLPMLRWFDFVVAVIAAVAMWLLSTLVPAWRVAKHDPAAVLAGSGKGTNVRASNRSVSVLVGLQVVISCIVLVTCGSLVTAVTAESNKPTGLSTSGVLLSTYPTTFDARYTNTSARIRYWDELATRIKRDVTGGDVAFTSAPPTRPARIAVAIDGRETSPNEGTLMLPVSVVSESYFEVLGIALRKGRIFDATDNDRSLKVAIIDEKMAARFWPGEDAIGKRIRLNSSADGWLTIVGVVSAVRGTAYRPDADLGSIYQPIRQAAPPAFHVLVKMPPGGDRRPALRAAAFAVDRDLPLHNLQLFDDYHAAINIGNKAMVQVFIAIALVTALLAASGLFGLISRAVAQRTQEVGIRRALGATRWRSTAMFMRQGAIYLGVAVAGLAIGVMLTPLLSRAIPNIFDFVIGVTAGVLVLMSIVIATASYLPTRRAVALEPGDALRYE